MVWAFWPVATPVKPNNMNYAPVVFGAVFVVSGVWYFFKAKCTYKGPVGLVDQQRDQQQTAQPAQQPAHQPMQTEQGIKMEELLPIESGSR